MRLRSGAPSHGDGAIHLATRGERLRIERAQFDTETTTLRGDLFDLARAALADAAQSAAATRELDTGHRASAPAVTHDGVGLPAGGCEISFESEIPLRSGLAGSTALLVALMQALACWRGAVLAPFELAERARRVEAERMKITCGFGDQYMTVFGGFRHLDFRGKAFATPDRPGPLASVESIPLDPSTLPFVLAGTGVRHSSSAVHTPIRARWLAGERAVVDGQARIAELAALGRRALLDGAFDRFGALMNENHAVTRALGGSGESNERLISAALAAGALGAKLAGAGDGGTVVALARVGEPSRVEAALREAGAAALFRLNDVPGVLVEPETANPFDASRSSDAFESTHGRGDPA